MVIEHVQSLFNQIMRAAKEAEGMSWEVIS